MVKVSVIIPVYNAEKYVKDALGECNGAEPYGDRNIGSR